MSAVLARGADASVASARGAFAPEILSGVSAIPRDAWDALLPGEAEGWDYYAACETSPPQEFCLSAVGASRNGVLVAAAPVFRLTYRLDTPLQGAWRPVGDWLYRTLPKLVKLPVMGLGSPLADKCHLGFAPDLTLVERQEAMAVLLQALDTHAAQLGVPVLAGKDLLDTALPSIDPAYTAERYTRVASLPVAVLDLPFKTEDEYLASLSSATRKDIRRKLKAASGIRLEIRHSIDGLEDEIVSLYDETRHQSGFDYGDLEKLSPSYFRDVMHKMGDRGVLMLYWLGDELLGFNLLLVGRDRVIDKFIGMRYPKAREHNLYAFSWMSNVRFCLERGIHQLQSGQTAYASKLRFGSRLDKTWVYFKHRSRPVNAIFRTIGPYLAFDKMDPDLAALAKTQAAKDGR